MELKQKFCTYQELADALGCSYQQVAKVHAKNIIKAFNIDKTRLPKSGTLPLDCVEEYFNVKKPLKNAH